jgi:Ni/Co efflux regulator RcnB
MKGTFTAASLRALALAAGLAALAPPAFAQEAEAEGPRPGPREDFQRPREDGPRFDRRQDPAPRPEFRPEPRPEAPAAPGPGSRSGGRPDNPPEAWGRYGQPREVRPGPAPDPRPAPGDRRRDEDRGGRDRDGRHTDGDRRYGYDGYRPYGHDGYRPYGYGGYRHDGRRPPRYDPRWYPPVWTPPYRYRGDPWVPPPGFAPRRWSYGEVLPWTWWTPRYRIETWWHFGLPVPPVGFAWVRLGRDAVLVDLWTGRIVQVAFSLFW